MRVFFLSLFCVLFIGAFGQNLSVNATLVDDAPPAVTDAYIDIYIIMGQSNAQGRGVSTDFDSDQFRPFGYPQSWWYAKGYIMNQTLSGTKFLQMEAGINTADSASQLGKWGIQPSWCLQLLRYKNRDLYFIQNAVGGLPISLWDSATSGYMYDSLVAMVGRANAYATSIGKVARYKAAVWWQYEQDVFAATDSTVYINALRGVISSTRVLTGNLSLPFLIIEGLGCQTSTNFNAQMGNIQNIIGAEPFNILIEAIGTETCRDAAHASSATYVLKGNQIFEAIKNL